MTRPVHLLAVAFLVVARLDSAFGSAPGCPSVGDPCANHLPKTGHGTDICLQPDPANDPTIKYACAGTPITLSVTASDQDVYGEPIVCDDAAPILSWSDTTDNQSSHEFNTPSTPGSYTVSCTASDGGDAQGQLGYDEPQHLTWTIYSVLLDIDVDSNNDGAIVDASDEPVEKAMPGKILVRNGAAAPVNLSMAPPTLPSGCTVVLSGTGGIAVWQNADKTGAVTLPASYAPGSLPATLYVSGTAIGGATLTLTLHTPNGDVCPDWVQLSVYDVPEAKLQDVTFTSAGTTANNFVVYVDGTTGPGYLTPHWHDDNLDGDATDPGDNQSPTCYTRGTLMEVSAVIKVTGDPSGWPATVLVKGDGPGNLDIPATNCSRSGDTISLPATASAGPFDNRVYWLNPLTISWFVSTDTGTTWKYVGTNANEVFIVLGAPGSTPLWRTVAKLATQNGGTDASTCLANTWASFAGPANVKAWDPTIQTYSKSLCYYNVHLGSGSTTAAELLLNADGQCEAWANLLKECLRVNNVHGYRIYVYPPSECGLNGQIGVKHITFKGTHYPPPFSMARTDLDTTTTGLPGQNKATPSDKLFPGHWIIKVGQDYYDPSYGAKYTGDTPESQIMSNLAVYGEWVWSPMHLQYAERTDGDGLIVRLEVQDSF